MSSLLEVPTTTTTHWYNKEATIQIDRSILLVCNMSRCPDIPICSFASIGNARRIFHALLPFSLNFLDLILALSAAEIGISIGICCKILK